MTTKLTFDQVVAALTAAQIPCTVKQYEYENAYSEYSVEFGYNWPEELVGLVDGAFGGSAPDYISLCGSSCGPTVIAQASIAGGPKDYPGAYNKW